MAFKIDRTIQNSKQFRTPRHTLPALFREATNMSQLIPFSIYSPTKYDIHVGTIPTLNIGSLLLNFLSRTGQLHQVHVSRLRYCFNVWCGPIFNAATVHRYIKCMKRSEWKVHTSQRLMMIRTAPKLAKIARFRTMNDIGIGSGTHGSSKLKSL